MKLRKLKAINWRRLPYTLSHPSIAVRLTVYFVVFGLIVGYVSLSLFTVTTSAGIIRMSAAVARKNIDRIQLGRRPDYLLGLEEHTLRDVFGDDSLVAELREISPVTDIKPYFLLRHPDFPTWVMLTEDEHGVFLLQTPPDDLVRAAIRALENSVSFEGSHFSADDSTVGILLNVTRQADLGRYVLYLQSDKRSVHQLLASNVRHVTFFGIFLLLFSALLGKFFARRITGPIIVISREATEIAAGHFDRRFAVTRRDEIGMLGEALNTMADSIEMHIDEIDRRMKAMETMNRIDKEVLSSVSRQELLDHVGGIVSNMITDADVAIALRNEERKGFDLLSFREGYRQSLLAEQPFISDERIGHELLTRGIEVFQVTDHSLIGHIEEFFIREDGTHVEVLLNVPIMAGGKYLGALEVVRCRRQPFSRVEMETIAMLADQVGVAMQSVKSFEEKEQLFLGILMALTRAIDAKSRWTAGHSERVARYAEAIGRSLGLAEDELRSLAIAAILHDIGKIAVPESILDKPARLDEQEYAVIRTHPETGVRILGDIPAYRDIVPGVLHHHEHWNGGGYPGGLRGDEIPLQSRIICLADVYDAITADRPYRSGMSQAEARLFIESMSGVMFDPALVGELWKVVELEQQQNLPSMIDFEHNLF